MTDAINKIAAEKSINNRTDSKYLDRSSIAKASKSVPYYTYSFDNETNKTSIPVYAKQKSTNNALAAFMSRLIFGSKPIKLLKIKELPLEEPVNRAEEIQRHGNAINFRNQYSNIGPLGLMTPQEIKDRASRQITDNENTQQQARDIDENKINQNIKTFIKNNCYKTIFNNIMEQDGFGGGIGATAPTTDKYDKAGGPNEADRKKKTTWLKDNNIVDPGKEKIDGEPELNGAPWPASLPMEPYPTITPGTTYWMKDIKNIDPRADEIDMYISKTMRSTDFPPDDLDKELLKFSDDATGVSFKKGKKGKKASFGFDNKGRWGYIPSTPDTPDTYDTMGPQDSIPFKSTDK